MAGCPSCDSSLEGNMYLVYGLGELLYNGKTCSQDVICSFPDAILLGCREHFYQVAYRALSKL